MLAKSLESLRPLAHTCVISGPRKPLAAMPWQSAQRTRYAPMPTVMASVFPSRGLGTDPLGTRQHHDGKDQVDPRIAAEHAAVSPWYNGLYRPACSGRYQRPSTFHHAAPIPSQIVMLTILTAAPTRHQVASGTWPLPKRIGAGAVP